MADVLHRVHLVYDQSHMTYQTIITQGGGASAIIHALKLANRYEELEREEKIDWRLRDGCRWNGA